VQRQRRDWGRQDAAYDSLQGWAKAGQAGNGGNGAPDAQAMSRGMLDLALASNDANLASKWAQDLHRAQEDALVARAMQGNGGQGAASGGGGMNPQLAQYLSGFNAQLGTGDANRYGLRRGVLENAGRDARFAQLGLAQQRQLAAADALLAHNPQRAMAMFDAVDKNLAQNVDRDNHLRAQLWGGNNQAAYQSAGLSRQDAALAESMRHNRFNEGMAAQRLNWDMASRAQSGNGAAAGRAGGGNYDPAKIRQWYVAEDEGGGKTFDQAGFERLGEAMVQYPDADPQQLHRLLQMQDAASRMQRRSDIAALQKNFAPGDFAQFAAESGAAPKSAREVLDFAGHMGLRLSAQQAHAVMAAMRNQDRAAANRARYDEAQILRAIESGQPLPAHALRYAPASLRLQYERAQRGQ